MILRDNRVVFILASIIATTFTLLTVEFIFSAVSKDIMSLISYFFGK